MVGTHAVPTADDLDALVLRLFQLKAPKDYCRCSKTCAVFKNHVAN